MKPKPPPESDIDKALWREATKRQGMLDGRWAAPWLVEALASFYAPEVLARFSIVDTSRNPAGFAWRSLNTLYEDAPTVSVDGSGDLSRISTPQLWAVRQDTQLRAIAMGESLVRLDLRDGRVRYRAVGADCVELWPDPDQPGVAGAVRETRWRVVSGMGCWTRETWDPMGIASGMSGSPTFKVEKYDDEHGKAEWVDVTQAVYSEWEGAPYPYTDAIGPILPYVLVHSEAHGVLRCPDRWSEIVAATLGAGCLHTFWIHGFRDCANPQPIAINAVPVGASVDGVNGALPMQVLLRDPASFQVWRTTDPAGAGSVSLLGSSMDAMAMLEAIDAYVASALRDAGLGPTDEAPAKGVSGVAISVSREALRRSQRQQRPAAIQADQAVLALAARLDEIGGSGSGLPTDPEAYSLQYRGIAPSTDEIRAIAERQRTLLDLGLTEPWIAILEVHPHLTPEQAQAMAARIEAAAAAKAPRIPLRPQVDPASDDDTTPGDST